MIERESIEADKFTYGQIVDYLQKLVDYHMESEVIEASETGYTESEVISFDGYIRPFKLPSEFTDELGLGNNVRCRVIGSVEEGMGIALILRSLYPFYKNVQGFYIQPSREKLDGINSDFDVIQAPATWPKRNGVYWGKELLDADNARLASPSTAETLLTAIQKHAQAK